MSEKMQTREQMLDGLARERKADERNTPDLRALVERLEEEAGKLRGYFNGLLVPEADLMDAAAAALTTLQHRVAEMEAALEIIERGDEPRPIGVMWRDDAKPSKNDRCVHSHWMYEDCGQCVAEFARSTLKDRGEGG